MGFLDSLFGTGGSASQEQQRTTATTNYPDWYNRLQQANLLRAGEAAFEEYQPYGGPRQALAGPSQREAREGFSGLASIAAPSYTEALEQARLGATQLAGADITPFMSPFQQAVTDVALREARRQGDIQRKELASQATRAGAFGGSRQGLQQAEAERNIQKNLADIQATGSQRAYESALAQLVADRSAAAKAAPQLAALGSGLQQTLTTGFKEAELAGERERAERQGALDIAYQDFLTQRQYPLAQASGLQSLLGGATVPGATLSSTFGQPPSVAGQIGGLGLTGLGMLGSGGAFGPGGMLAGMFLKDGGEVSDDLKYQDGSPDGVSLKEGVEQLLAINAAAADGQSSSQVLLDFLTSQLESGFGDDENITTQVYELLSYFPLGETLERKEEIRESMAASDVPGPRSDPDAAMTPLLAEIMAADEDVTEPEPDTDDGADDGADDGVAAEVEDRGFDYEDLITAGLAMMQAAAQPGASVLGSASAGGLTALQAKKEEDALRREEALKQLALDLEGRQLDILETANEQDFMSAMAALSREQLEDQLSIIDDDIDATIDELESFMELGGSVTGRTQEDLDNELQLLISRRDIFRSMLGLGGSGLSIPADAAQD